MSKRKQRYLWAAALLCGAMLIAGIGAASQNAYAAADYFSAAELLAVKNRTEFTNHYGASPMPVHVERTAELQSVIRYKKIGMGSRVAKKDRVQLEGFSLSMEVRNVQPQHNVYIIFGQEVKSFPQPVATFKGFTIRLMRGKTGVAGFGDESKLYVTVGKTHDQSAANAVFGASKDKTLSYGEGGTVSLHIALSAQTGYTLTIGDGDAASALTVPLARSQVNEWFASGSENVSQAYLILAYSDLPVKPNTDLTENYPEYRVTELTDPLRQSYLTSVFESQRQIVQAYIDAASANMSAESILAAEAGLTAFSGEELKTEDAYYLSKLLEPANALIAESAAKLDAQGVNTLLNADVAAFEAAADADITDAEGVRAARAVKAQIDFRGITDADKLSVVNARIGAAERKIDAKARAVVEEQVAAFERAAGDISSLAEYTQALALKQGIELSLLAEADEGAFDARLAEAEELLLAAERTYGVSYVLERAEQAVTAYENAAGDPETDWTQLQAILDAEALRAAVVLEGVPEDNADRIALEARILETDKKLAGARSRLVAAQIAVFETAVSAAADEDTLFAAAQARIAVDFSLMPDDALLEDGEKLADLEERFRTAEQGYAAKYAELIVPVLERAESLFESESGPSDLLSYLEAGKTMERLDASLLPAEQQAAFQARVDALKQAYEQHFFHSFRGTGLAEAKKTEHGLQFTTMLEFGRRVNYNKPVTADGFELSFTVDRFAYLAPAAGEGARSNAAIINLLDAPDGFKAMTIDGVKIRGLSVYLWFYSGTTAVKVYSGGENVAVLSDAQLGPQKAPCTVRLKVTAAEDGWLVDVNGATCTVSYAEIPRDIFPQGKAYFSMGFNGTTKSEDALNTVTIHSISDLAIGEPEQPDDDPGATSTPPPTGIIPPDVNGGEDAGGNLGLILGITLPCGAVLIGGIALLLALRRRKKRT